MHNACYIWKQRRTRRSLLSRSSRTAAADVQSDIIYVYYKAAPYNMYIYVYDEDAVCCELQTDHQKGNKTVVSVFIPYNSYIYIIVNSILIRSSSRGLVRACVRKSQMHHNIKQLTRVRIRAENDATHASGVYLEQVRMSRQCQRTELSF